MSSDIFRPPSSLVRSLPGPFACLSWIVLIIHNRSRTNTAQAVHKPSPRSGEVQSYSFRHSSLGPFSPDMTILRRQRAPCLSRCRIQQHNFVRVYFGPPHFLPTETYTRSCDSLSDRRMAQHMYIIRSDPRMQCRPSDEDRIKVRLRSSEMFRSRSQQKRTCLVQLRPMPQDARLAMFCVDGSKQPVTTAVVSTASPRL